jgi:cyclic-di-GMP-binding protein
MPLNGSGGARDGPADRRQAGSMKAMLGFLTPQGKEAADPLQNAKSAAAWLRQLPALDVIGRQQHVIRVLDATRKDQYAFDLSRVGAIEFVDAALGADRRQLIKQYIENAESSPKLADRIWQALWEMSQAFTLAYQTALETALSEVANARWKSALPLLFVRLVHFQGTDAKLRVFKYERWIPAKWIELHQVYLRSCEMGCDRQPMALPATGAGAQSWSAEQEYLYVLLVHQLNTGNLGPAEVDWASSQLRAWSRRLALEQIPKSVEGFYVDLAGRSGLVRRDGNDRGSVLRYVDTTILADAMDRAVNALRDAEASDQGPIAAINQQRLVVLRKIQPALSPSSLADHRRDPRISVAISARVRIGLSRICQDLAARAAGESPVDSSSGEQIEVFPVAGAPRARRKPLVEDDSLAASLSSWSDPMWEVKDRSVAGLRIAATGGIGQSLTLGALVAVRQSDADAWLLGVVRRLNKVSNEEVEAGVNIIAERIVSVTLAAKRRPNEDMGYVIDGLDLSTMGERFEGLYLPPPSRPDKPLAIKTLIIPTSEYVEGRNVILTTANSIYTVALKHLVEQRPDWSWATIQIVEKAARKA